MRWCILRDPVSLCLSQNSEFGTDGISLVTTTPGPERLPGNQRLHKYHALHQAGEDPEAGSSRKASVEAQLEATRSRASNSQQHLAEQLAQGVTANSEFGTDGISL
ncbi:hypothetical protein NHX12_018352, partial [Muraenolepis orangiensis]